MPRDVALPLCTNEHLHLGDGDRGVLGDVCHRRGFGQAHGSSRLEHPRASELDADAAISRVEARCCAFCETREVAVGACAVDCLGW